MSAGAWLRRAAREPLLHFVALGALLFAIYASVHRGEDASPDKIVVTRTQLQHLATGFSLTWRRPPNAEELQGLVNDYIREEVYYREAVAMGLERDDSVVRRRLQQKMEFVSQDVVSVAEPTDQDLRAFLAAHREAFQGEERLTFEQIYFDPQRHKGSLDADARAVLVKSRSAQASEDISALGDPFLLADRFESIPMGEVTKLFGEKFAAGIRVVSPGEWSGPVASGYGIHLVRVTAHDAGAAPAFEHIRDQVKREWFDAQRQKTNEDFYQKMLSRYTIVIEPVKTAARVAESAIAQR
jgi:hypothetical protein